MKQPHKDAEIIKAWADGAEIEFRTHNNVEWSPVFKGWSWDSTVIAEYRIKPEPKPDFVYYGALDEPASGGYTLGSCFTTEHHRRDQLKLTFDGSTGKLKSAEVL